MPLSEPSGNGGTDRKTNLGQARMFGTGPDTAINFHSGSFDPENSRGLIGGNTSFAGFIADLKLNKITEFATLPSTVIPSGNVTQINPNGIDDGVLVRILNRLARTDDNGASWIDITPGETALGDIVSWRGDLVCLFNATGAPVRDITQSADNGATWPDTGDTTLDIFSAVRFQLLKSSGDGILVAIGGRGLAFTADNDATDDTQYTSFDFAALFGFSVPAGAAINDAGTHCVYFSTQSQMAVSTDGLVSFTAFDNLVNPFRSGTGTGQIITDVTYVDVLDGFIITGDMDVAFFMPIATPMDSGSIMTIALSERDTIATNNSGFSDGTNLLVPTNDNNSLRTIQIPI